MEAFSSTETATGSIHGRQEETLFFGDRDGTNACTPSRTDLANFPVVPERCVSDLSLRMGIRRFTRLTNAFSKKWENHAAAIMLWYAYYNFCRIHKSLRVTPAMEAGIADHIWDLAELLSC